MSNKWYVITGGPSTGKSTLLAELEKRGHKIVPEAARTLIDKALKKGVSAQELRADEKKFQEDVANLKKEIEAGLDSDVLTFFDRGMHDTLAYMRHYGFNIDKWVENLMQNSSYRKVFLLEPLKTYQTDYARTEDSSFRKYIDKLLYDVYTEFGMEPIRVPVASAKARAKFVLESIKAEQGL